MPHQGQVLDDGNTRMEFRVTAADSDGELHEMLRVVEEYSDVFRLAEMPQAS